MEGAGVGWPSRRVVFFFYFFLGALRATSSASCHVSETVTLTLAGQ